jgi:hypothetical protein
MNYLIAVLGVAFGVAAFVFGGYDDSPGAQLIGALVVIASVSFAVKTYRQRMRGTS